MATSPALTEGKNAPAFSMATDRGGKVALKDLKGQIIVLYFYPKDDTSGCTREGIEFTKALPKFKRQGAVVIGVSKDSAAKHDKFKHKHGLKITLGSDEDGKVVERYGVWIQKSMYGRKYMGIDRSTFLIDGAGRLNRIWRKVKVPGHVEEVLAAVKEVAKAS